MDGRRNFPPDPDADSRWYPDDRGYDDRGYDDRRDERAHDDGGRGERSRGQRSRDEAERGYGDERGYSEDRGYTPTRYADEREYDDGGYRVPEPRGGGRGYGGDPLSYGDSPSGQFGSAAAPGRGGESGEYSGEFVSRSRRSEAIDRSALQRPVSGSGAGSGGLAGASIPGLTTSGSPIHGLPTITPSSAGPLGVGGSGAAGGLGGLDASGGAGLAGGPGVAGGAGRGMADGPGAGVTSPLGGPVSGGPVSGAPGSVAPTGAAYAAGGSGGAGYTAGGADGVGYATGGVGGVGGAGGAAFGSGAAGLEGGAGGVGSTGSIPSAFAGPTALTAAVPAPRQQFGAVDAGGAVYQSKRPGLAVALVLLTVLFEVPVLRLFIHAMASSDVPAGASLAGIFMIPALPMFSMGLYGLIGGAAAAGPGVRPWLRTPLAYLPVALLLFIAAGLAA